MDKIKSFRLYDYNVYDGISKHSQEKNKYSQDSLDHYKDNKNLLFKHLVLMILTEQHQY